MTSKSLSFLVVWALVAAGYFYLTPGVLKQLPDQTKPSLTDQNSQEPELILPGQDQLGDVGTFQVEVGEREDASGTAFAVAPKGFWITARHVIDGCSKVGIGVGRDGPNGRPQYIRAKTFKTHPSADIGIVTGRSSGPALNFSTVSRESGLAGFHYGYPQGKPAAVRSVLLGKGRMRSTGRYSTRERVLIWSSKERAPNFQGTLGGISGGPVVDARGHLIGVTVAGSVRRGRIITTTSDTVQNMLGRVGKSAHPDKGRKQIDARITAANFANVGAKYRKDWAVTKVVCAS